MINVSSMNYKSKKVIFTICAKNYYGLAQVLKKSVLEHNHDIDFYIFIADGISTVDASLFGDDAIDATNIVSDYISREKFLEISFKYNLTEYCTSIKPFCFRYLFDFGHYSHAVYLDPDIFIYSSMSMIFERLDDVSIVLTPHIIFPSSLEGKRTDSGIMSTGIFNLGFIGICNTDDGYAFLKWWGFRLLDQCFVDGHHALFTDQKWIDFLPALYPKDVFCVLRHLGANLAPWNFHERLISKDISGNLVVERRNNPLEDLPFVKYEQPEPLLFVHFSGFDYKRLCYGEVAQHNIEGLEIYPDLNPLVDKYTAEIQEKRDIVLRFLNINYEFSNFTNGMPILSFHRRLYRSSIESGLKFGDPFCAEEGTLYWKLAERHLLVKKSEVNHSDKANKHNFKGIGVKVKIVNFIMRILLRIIGFNNYILVLRLMRPYSRPENHLHLIDSKINKL